MTHTVKLFQCGASALSLSFSVLLCYIHHSESSLLAERKTKSGNKNLRAKHCGSLRSSLCGLCAFEHTTLVSVLSLPPTKALHVSFLQLRMRTEYSDNWLEVACTSTDAALLCLRTLACFIFELCDLLLTLRVAKSNAVTVGLEGGFPDLNMLSIYLRNINIKQLTR